MNQPLCGKKRNLISHCLSACRGFRSQCRGEMLLRWEQRGCWVGESLWNRLWGVGRAEQRWQWSQTEVCSQDIRGLSLPERSLCWVNLQLVLPARCKKVLGFACAGKEQSSLLMSLKDQFVTVWT